MQKNINLKYNGKKYDIEYKRTKNVLYFNDKNGASIGFVKVRGSLSVFVNDKYSNPKMWKKYPRLKGTNVYTLAPKQVKIFIEWFYEGKFKKD
jgi:hypothetical protein